MRGLKLYLRSGVGGRGGMLWLLHLSHMPALNGSREKLFNHGHMHLSAKEPEPGVYRSTAPDSS